MNSLLDDSQSMDSIIWQKVIKHMYEEHDYVTLRNLLIEDGEVLYGSLLRRVLNFQLKEHERYLEKFNRLFKIQDSDADGVIDQGKFIILMNQLELGISFKEINNYLVIVDPYGLGKVTFSDIIYLLTT